jgi:hypothetical protein
MKVVVICLSRGYAIRDFIHSGMIDELLKKDDLKIVFLVPSQCFLEIKKMLPEDDRIKFETLVEIRKNLLLPERIIWGISYRLKKNKFLFPASLQLNNKLYLLFRKKYYAQLFKKYNPALVVTCNPGYHSKNDVQLIREARHYGIKTFSLVPSWDNPFTKSIIEIYPDRMSVWNNQILNDIAKIYHYDKNRLTVTGPPQFDFYFKDNIFEERESFFKNLGLDSNKKLITVILCPTKHGDSSFILRVLEEAMKNKKFICPVQIFCRMHPSDPAELFEEYKRKFSLITFEHYRFRHQYFGWAPDWKEAVHKVATLKYSACTINLLTTMMIEAVIIDTPAVNIGFAPDEKFDRFIKARHSLHFQYVVNQKAIRTVKTETELIEAINEYLANPKLDSQERKKFAEDFCYKLDGRAHKRIANLISELA